MYFGGGYLLFSPVAAEVLKRRGYKFTIIMGLCLYSLGAIAFWPAAHFTDPDNKKAAFGGFLVCTLVIACGLATLETSANSYAVVIGNPASASARLQFCQSWNGVASFIGPLIASKVFFSEGGSDDLTSVQYVYLAVACAGAAVAILFFFARLPEVSEAVVEGTSTADNPDAGLDGEVAQGPLWRQYNMLFAFWAQFCYVGAQVAVASFFINYATENASFTAAQGSNMLSYGLIVFTVGRFVGTGLATFLQSDFIMIVYAAIAIALSATTAAVSGTPGVAVLITLFFFEAPMYPTLFSMGTANLGRHTKRGAGVLVMGVSGGAVFPPIQGAIADAAGTRISYLVPMGGFCVVLAYCVAHWLRTGRHILRVKEVVAVNPEAAGMPEAWDKSDVEEVEASQRSKV